MLNQTRGAVSWNRKIIFHDIVQVGTANTEGVFWRIVGKINSATWGTPASGNYVGYKIENETLVSGVVCKSNVLATVAFTPVAFTGSAISIVTICENGNVAWYGNGILLGQTLDGPNATNSTGTTFCEIANGATAANYLIRLSQHSEGY
jgi:hypothetical protein